MTKDNEAYKCTLCGNIAEILHTGAGDMSCCGSPMDLVVENSVDAAQEKHVPVIEKTNNGYKVTVGSVAHPMVDKHWIEWIELICDNQIYRRKLIPGQSPEALFCVNESIVSARAYCNLHGLWAS